MAYTTRAEIDAMLGASVVSQALDENRDGLEDDGRFEALQTLADEKVDSILDGAYEVPFSEPYPAKVKVAAREILAAMIARTDESRQTDAKAAIERLEKIAAGDMAIEYDDTDVALEDAIEEPDGDYDLDDMEGL